MAKLLRVSVAIVLSCSSCSVCKKGQGASDVPSTYFATIADKDAKAADFLHAIHELDAVTELPTFWTAIVNNPDYTAVHRGYCVVELFGRHVSAGVKLSELASILDGAKWLKKDDLDVVALLAGKIPVRWTADDTVFVLRVFPELPGRSWAVYLRVAGKVDRDAFMELIRRRKDAERIGGKRLLEIGISAAMED